MVVGAGTGYVRKTSRWVQAGLRVIDNVSSSTAAMSGISGGPASRVVHDIPMTQRAGTAEAATGRAENGTETAGTGTETATAVPAIPFGASPSPITAADVARSPPPLASPTPPRSPPWCPGTPPE